MRSRPKERYGMIGLLEKWRQKRREKKRVEQERTGDTPERRGEGPPGSGYSGRESAERAGNAGIISGGS
jgi:hypothetical protein